MPNSLKFKVLRYPCLNPCLTATMGKVRVNFSFLSLSSLSHSRLYYYWGWPFTPKSVITSQNMKITTWNFQDMILRAKPGHPWYQGWPCHLCLKSGTLNVLQVPPKKTPILGTLLIKIWTQNFQNIFLGVKWYHQCHNGWCCSPSLQSRTLSLLRVPP